MTFILRRLLHGAWVLLAVSALVFAALYVVGNPVELLVDPQADPADTARTIAALGLEKPLIAVKGTRRLQKSDMVLNGATPKIDVDPETYAVRADGQLLVCEPAAELPLAQRYFLF